MRTILTNLAFLAVLFVISACTAMPARQAADAANIVYTQGSTHHMIAAQVPVDASRLYHSFVRVIGTRPNVTIVAQKDEAMMLEVGRGELRLTGQVSALGAGQSLLYIWADAGDSGLSGKALSEKAVALVCEDLGVSINRVDY